MAKQKKNNKLKRKRGKKFVFHGEGAQEGTEAAPNPFEEHSKTKRARKDLEKRQGLIEEYRNLGKNS